MSSAMAPHGLNLGSLVYTGSPTQGSVIVYSSMHQCWSRVPIQEVVPPGPHVELIRLLERNSSARWMMGGLVAAMLCVVAGLYGLSHGRHPDVRAADASASSRDDLARYPTDL